MSEYKRFAGINAWTFSDNRAIIWFGGKDSHWDRRRHLTWECGRSYAVGLEVTVGGEEGEIKLRIGLLFWTLYIGVTNLVRSDRSKIEAAMAGHEKRSGRKLYAYELDYADQGRRTGLMVSFFDRDVVFTASLWENPNGWSKRPLAEKFRCWPYCEGASWSWYPLWNLKWKTLSKSKTEPETHDYTYVLKSGKVQSCKATITSETAHLSRWWWYPFKKTVRGIDVKFSDEVGERSGSWKGGTIGCGYTMNDGETPLECLRRMESERKF